MTEQAYHARGAGRDALRECVEALDSIWAAIGDALCSGKGIEKAYANVVANETRQASDKAKVALREPGADTGTTPPPDVLRSALLKCEQWNAEHGNWSEEMEDIVERALRAAERGTTPPEGLSAELKRISQSLEDPNASRIIAIAALDSLRNRLRAATQRAPVEQGRERMEYDLLWMNCISAAAQATFPKGMHPADELKLRVEAIASSMKPCKLPAPDHAREGALREALERIPESVFALYLDPPQREVIRATLAATQRAPVEQAAPQPWGYAYRYPDGIRVDTGGRKINGNKPIEAIPLYLGAPAPDHAREGATMKCPKCGVDAFAHGETCPVSREGALRGLIAKWREGKVATKLRDDMQMRGGKWIADLCADELEHALANGKEEPLMEALELAKGALANGSTIDQRYETYKIVCAALADGKEVFDEHAKKCVKCWATLRKDSRDAPCDEGAKLLAQSICAAAFGADGKEGGE